MTRSVAAGLLSALAAAGLFSVAGASAAEPAENIVFPADAGVINVRDLGARGDGVADDTAAIQQALAAHPNEGAIIYLPDGTYLISDTLIWPHGMRGGSEEKRTILQGQSQAGTVLKLKDSCPGFTDPAKPKAMIWTGQKPAQRFGNAVRNLTFDTGRGNLGAIGAQFMANNQGCFRNVTIRSGDGAGLIGLDLGYTDEQGPCLIKNVHVIGFDVGISCRHAVDSITLEHITLEGQRQAGLVNDGQCVSIRGLAVRGAATAVQNRGSALMALVDAAMVGTGAAADKPAIENRAALLARNVKAPGYRKAIDSGEKSPAGAQVAEFVSHGVLSVFPSPPQSLGLPVKETPEVPWDALDQWANGAAGAQGKDITRSLQAAIDSGKTTVYIPRGSYKITATVLVRGAVRRIIGCEAWIDIETGAQSGLKVVDGTAPVVVLERVSGGYGRSTFVEHAAARTLAIKSCCNLNCFATGTGDLFIEDVCSNPFTHFEFRGQNVWARQFNVENEGTHVLNDGGTLWILGLKTERGGTLIETRGGGRTECIGGFCYTTTDPKGAPMFVSSDSAVSITIGESCFGGRPYETLVRETRGGETRELKKGQAPGRTGGSMLPLYVGHK